MPFFEHDTLFPCSAEGLFDFLTKPANIQAVSDPNLGLRFDDPPSELAQGATLSFKIATFGQILELQHEIIKYERPRQVIERQLKGPMKSWDHHHEYVVTDGGVIKKDRVEFELPGGLLGFFLTEDKVIDQLEDGFFFRQERINQLISQGRIQ